jgi:Fe-S oxidoreductase
MLEDYKEYMLRCARCSNCKFLPHAVLKSKRFADICPSINQYNFHTYSGGGRLVTALSLLEGRLDLDDSLVDIIYKCQVCGGCDVSCKYGLDLEILEPIYELRIRCVEEGKVPESHREVMDGLRKEGNMMRKAAADRGKWAEGLDVKRIMEEKADVYYHAGCRYSYDEELWGIARQSVNLLKKAGVDIGIGGKDEACCGGRAYELGYAEEFKSFAPESLNRLLDKGVKTIVTGCADCYHAFKILFDKIGIKGDLKVYHITEYLLDLIEKGKIRPKNNLDMVVTYHDPCHLGRMGEPWIPWKGKIKTDPSSRIIHEPIKEWRKGAHGVYEAPRNVLKSIPGLKLVEMERIKEYSWCCGAGGGVIDAYPDYNMAIATERIKEAKDTGAESIVTSCPWCIRNFKDAVRENNENLKVYDVVEIFEQSF